MDLSLRVPRPPESGSGGEMDESRELDVVEDEDGSDTVVEDEDVRDDGSDTVVENEATGRAAKGNGNGGGPLASDLQLFLDRIGQYPLLTASQEIELAKRIERGDHQARNRLITCNLRLVVSIAKRYRLPEASGLSLLDLVQEGIVGLIRAAELYDWRTGNRFSTYATLWIRQGVSRAIMLKGQAIRVPTSVRMRMRAVVRAEQDLRRRLGREPDDAETATLAGLDVVELRALRLRSTTCSLDQPVEQGTSLLGELIPSSDDVFEDVSQRLRGAALREAVGELPTRLREVIVLRYGMAGHEPHSLAAIGRRFGLTRERARQLERKALDQLAKAASVNGGDRGKAQRRLGGRLGAFDPAALLAGLKAMLAASTSTNVAAGIAVVATAGAVAPVPFDLYRIELPLSSAVVSSEPAATRGTSQTSRVAIRHDDRTIEDSHTAFVDYAIALPSTSANGVDRVLIPVPVANGTVIALPWPDERPSGLLPAPYPALLGPQGSASLETTVWEEPNVSIELDDPPMPTDDMHRSGDSDAHTPAEPAAAQAEPEPAPANVSVKPAEPALVPLPPEAASAPDPLATPAPAPDPLAEPAPAPDPLATPAPEPVAVPPEPAPTPGPAASPSTEPHPDDDDSGPSSESTEAQPSEPPPVPQPTPALGGSEPPDDVAPPTSLEATAVPTQD
jgi:RNA polymerase primary sigma factor